MKMNSILSKIMIFAAGAIVGSAVTCKVLTTKYEQQVREDVESVKREFAKIYQNDNGDVVTKAEESSEDDEEDEETRNNYNSIINKNGYATNSNDEEKEEDKDMNNDKPYVIPPDEFGECEYAEVSLTYYADGVVTNDSNKIIGNVDELIGADSLSHFGEYEDDSVFVRNDKLRIDFEILKDYRNYSEI